MAEGRAGGEGDSEDIDVAANMLRRLRSFALSLPEEERVLLAALLGPGVALAYGESVGSGEDVTGFSMVDWSPAALPAHLAQAVRSQRMRVEFG